MGLKSITKKFGEVRAINETSFHIKEGEIFALINPNGAGKTTPFNIITGNYKPTSGEVFFQNGRINDLELHKIVHLGIARTFQSIRLFSGMSVLENIMISFNKQMEYSVLEAFLHLGYFHRVEQEFKNKAYKLLEGLGISEFADEKAISLGHGQQRRVEIARAMATNPELLLLGEPAAGMNSSEGDKLAELILKLGKDYKISVLLIEHDVKFVSKLCDKVLVLDYGKIIFEGKIGDAINHKGIIATYLGDFDAND